MNVRRAVSVCLVLLVGIVLTACGGGGDQSTQTTTDQSTSSQSAGSGSIIATANFSGGAPEPEVFNLSGNSECEVDEQESRKVVINDNKTLKNVVVAVKSGPSGLDRTPESPVMDQVNCMYEPHVITAKVDQSIDFKDSDPSMHNVRAIKKGGGQVFNLTTFEGDSKKKSFGEPGAYSVECNVHPWMQGWIYVTDHGYATTTDNSGKAKLSNLPAGDYTLEFWHEEYGTKTKEVSLDDGEQLDVSASFNS